MKRPTATTAATTAATPATRWPARRPATRRIRPSPSSAANTQLVDLALQGGGSHGAFTWGVLDRLLDDETLKISGISGTSAGAMNAVALAAGLMEGGRQGAQACLARFWKRVAEASPFHALDASPLGPLLGRDNPWLQAALAPWQLGARIIASQFSPYQLNPLNLNPLKQILVDTVDFERVRHCNRTQLFIAATHVATGELRVFRQDELTADMVLASACLPLLFQAVDIDGQAYWDGGYAGNPTLLPMIGETPADDLLLVQINPTRRDETPTEAAEILERANEVTFNASLLKELRSIGLIQSLLNDAGRPDAAFQRPLFKRIDNLRLHRLDAEAQLAPLGASSKMETSWRFLSQLHQIGRQAADRWLAQHRSDLGQRASYRLPPALLG